MNRTEFLEQLERLLWDIPESEKTAALEYYEDYFEDAGEENEGKVIQELGSPGKVAAIIRADLENDPSPYGEYTETGYTDERFQEKKVPEPSEMKENSERSETGQEENNWDGTRYRDPQGERRQHSYDGPYSRAGYGRNYGQNPRHSRSGAGWILLIIFAVVALPFVFGFGMGALGLLIGIIGGIIGLLAGGIGLTVGGLMFLIHSLVFQLASPPTAVACVGGALMMTAVGILLLLAFIWLIFRAFPAVFRWAVDLIQRVLHRGIRGGENS
ncbi:MAG TPA: DUF1700 domain-containing protein [Candidatus Blautia merdigallinarum]|uniref:DUF1700 domain-containing protein n=1 Tax=Candidatus Blautia merdigallinarum TaxID=2838495 RepID=A0A9D2N316_9FIRM|nr:DUF1700 domain-containing protein [Candidatus Blautia merdigallinarum]